MRNELLVCQKHIKKKKSFLLLSPRKYGPFTYTNITFQYETFLAMGTMGSGGPCYYNTSKKLPMHINVILYFTSKQFIAIAVALYSKKKRYLELKKRL